MINSFFINVLLLIVILFSGSYSVYGLACSSELSSLFSDSHFDKETLYLLDYDESLLCRLAHKSTSLALDLRKDPLNLDKLINFFSFYRDNLNEWIQIKESDCESLSFSNVEAQSIFTSLLALKNSWENALLCFHEILKSVDFFSNNPVMEAKVKESLTLLMECLNLCLQKGNFEYINLTTDFFDKILSKNTTSKKIRESVVCNVFTSFFKIIRALERTSNALSILNNAETKMEDIVVQAQIIRNELFWLNVNSEDRSSVNRSILGDDCYKIAVICRTFLMEQYRNFLTTLFNNSKSSPRIYNSWRSCLYILCLSEYCELNALHVTSETLSVELDYEHLFNNAFLYYNDLFKDDEHSLPYWLELWKGKDCLKSILDKYILNYIYKTSLPTSIYIDLLSKQSLMDLLDHQAYWSNLTQTLEDLLINKNFSEIPSLLLLMNNFIVKAKMSSVVRKEFFYEYLKVVNKWIHVKPDCFHFVKSNLMLFSFYSLYEEEDSSCLDDLKDVVASYKKSCSLKFSKSFE